MIYRRELTVAWGESDPFGLVYYPRMLEWFNDTEHELFRNLGYPIDGMIRDNRTTFVMGEISFRFVGPAAYGDRVTTRMDLVELRERTLHWRCEARLAGGGAPVTQGTAVRVYARINADGSLESVPIPAAMRGVLAPGEGSAADDSPA